MRDDTPTDVVILILQSLPNLDALYNAIQTSRHVYTTFVTHTQAIYRAIAQSEAGPMFESAAKLAIMQLQSNDIRWDLRSKPVGVEILPLRQEIGSLVWDLTLVKTIREIVRTVETLQALYSRWYKDVSSSVSVLTPEQAAQFNQAMTFFMLFWTIFRPAWVELENNRCSFRQWSDVQMKLQRAQVFFIDQIFGEGEERNYFVSVAHFLKKAAGWSSCTPAQLSQPVHSSELWHGIAKIATLRNQHNYLYTYEYDYGDFQGNMFLDSWISSANDFHGPPPFLDVQARVSPCFQYPCAACLGESPCVIWFEPIWNIYNRCNWELFYGYPFAMRNLFGTSPIFASLRRSKSAPELLQLILGYAREQGEMKRPEPWLCHNCMVRIIEKYRKIVRWKLLIPRGLGHRGAERT